MADTILLFLAVSAKNFSLRHRHMKVLFVANNKGIFFLCVRISLIRLSKSESHLARRSPLSPPGLGSSPIVSPSGPPHEAISGIGVLCCVEKCVQDLGPCPTGTQIIVGAVCIGQCSFRGWSAGAFEGGARHPACSWSGSCTGCGDGFWRLCGSVGWTEKKPSRFQQSHSH